MVNINTINTIGVKPYEDNWLQSIFQECQQRRSNGPWKSEVYGAYQKGTVKNMLCNAELFNWFERLKDPLVFS